MNNKLWRWPLLMGCLVASATLMAQSLTVTGHVTLLTASSRSKSADNSNAVVYLTPLDVTHMSSALRSGPPPHHFRLVQKNKRFIPHILVIPEGAVVNFPMRILSSITFFHSLRGSGSIWASMKPGPHVPFPSAPPG